MIWADAFHLTTLDCAHRSGESRHFEVRVELLGGPGGNGLLCMIRPTPPIETGEAYYFADFHEVQPGLMQLQGLRNGLPESFQHCGITRTLIPILAKIYGWRVRSSTTQSPDEEMRTQGATASWDHMVRDGLARYEASEDRYYYPADSSSRFATSRGK